MVSHDEPVENAWLRSHAQCEGGWGSHAAGHRCARDLVWEHRGRADCEGAWEAYRKNPRVLAGWEAVQQITILCWECYQQVPDVTAPRAVAQARSRGHP